MGILGEIKHVLTSKEFADAVKFNDPGNRFMYLDDPSPNVENNNNFSAHKIPEFNSFKDKNFMDGLYALRPKINVLTPNKPVDLVILKPQK